MWGLHKMISNDCGDRWCDDEDNFYPSDNDDAGRDNIFDNTHI